MSLQTQTFMSLADFIINMLIVGGGLNNNFCRKTARIRASGLLGMGVWRQRGPVVSSLRSLRSHCVGRHNEMAASRVTQEWTAL